MELPSAVDALANELIGLEGVEAVALGGSRALGVATPSSDWDLGVYYRGPLDLSRLARRGQVFPPGAWGRLMNGGSWLDVDGTRVDVLLRDLDAVERWAAEAQAGRFEIDGLPGYVAGIPTYSLVAEAAVNVVLRGALPLDTNFPLALAEAAPTTWRFCRDFSLYHADAHARRDSVAGTVGQVARAVLEEAHARCCADATWVINEKYLVGSASMIEVERRLPAAMTTGSLTELVAAARTLLLDDNSAPIDSVLGLERDPDQR